jgi:hypothetical protein
MIKLRLMLHKLNKPLRKIILLKKAVSTSITPAVFHQIL